LAWCGIIRKQAALIEARTAARCTYCLAVSASRDKDRRCVPVRGYAWRTIRRAGETRDVVCLSTVAATKVPAKDAPSRDWARAKDVVTSEQAVLAPSTSALAEQAESAAA